MLIFPKNLQNFFLKFLALSDIKREEVFSDEHKSIRGSQSNELNNDRNSVPSFINSAEQKKKNQLVPEKSQIATSRKKSGSSASHYLLANPKPSPQTKKEIQKSIASPKGSPAPQKATKVLTALTKKQKEEEKRLKAQEEAKRKKEQKLLLKMQKEKEEQELLIKLEKYYDMDLQETDDFELWQKAQYKLINPSMSKAEKKKRKKKIKKKIEKEKKRRAKEKLEEEEMKRRGVVLHQDAGEWIFSIFSIFDSFLCCCFILWY